MAAQLAGARHYRGQSSLVLPGQTGLAAPFDFYLSKMANRCLYGLVVFAGFGNCDRSPSFLAKSPNLGKCGVFRLCLFSSRTVPRTRTR